MDAATLTNYFYQYGAIFIFVIVFLEYLNLPGFPAGIIMPLAGIWAARGGVGFITALIISVLAGLLGSWILYFIGLWGGEYVLKKYIKKFPKQEKVIKEKLEFLRKKGNVGVFISKLLPAVRTLISIPAGVLKLDFIKYTIWSTLGIVIWNASFMSAGYFLGDKVLQVLA